MDFSFPVSKNQRLLDNANVGDEEDGISKLPDGVLSHIFSFLSTKEVVRTSILSKRWEYAWIMAPNLDFKARYDLPLNIDSIIKMAYFKFFVDHVLFHHGGSTIRKCSFHCCTKYLSPYLYAWICAVLSCDVQELFIISSKEVRTLPRNLFTSTTLVSLKIYGTYVLDLPTRLYFPSLKTLSLSSVKYVDDFSMQRLFVSCPVLENLYIMRHHWDGVLTASISVPSLKRLLISVSDVEPMEGYEYKTEINAPHLEYLHLNDCASNDVSVNFSASLVEAQILGRCTSRLLTKISHVKHLWLSGIAMEHLSSVPDVVFPTFHNVTRLELGFSDSIGWDLLADLLQSCSNLKVLVFVQGLIKLSPYGHGFHSFFWNPPESPPDCLRLHLKQIEVHSFVGRPCERFLMRYLLQHANVLDKLIIHWYFFSKKFENRNSISQGKILGYEKGSSTCQIEFVPRSYDSSYAFLG